MSGFQLGAVQFQDPQVLPFALTASLNVSAALRDSEGIPFNHANQVELSRRGSVWALKRLWAGFVP